MPRLRRLLHYARPYRRIFLLGFVAAVVASALDGMTFALLIPFFRTLFGQGPAVPLPAVVDRVAGGWMQRLAALGPSTALRDIALLILTTVAVKGVFAYTSNFVASFVQERVVRDIRLAWYAHVQRLGLGFFRRFKGGELVSRVFSDADNIKFAVGQGVASALQNTALVLVYAVILFVIDWRLALVAAVLAPAAALGMRPVIQGVRRHQRNAMRQRGEATALVSETTAGARVVKTHGAEPQELERIGGTIRAVTDAATRAQRFGAMASPLSETVGAACVVVLVFVGTWSFGAGAVRPELFLAFLAIAARLLQPLKQLAQFPPQLEQSLVAADRVFEILDFPADDVDPPGAAAFPGLARDIEFRDVWFAYEDEAWVLRGLDLAIPKGSVVALVGLSGAGKSTLVDMLPRFIAPQRGAVLVDGVPLERYSRKSLRSAIGYVGQETMLFHDTVRANIAYGDHAGARPATVEAAARAANAHEFITALPQGYDTVIGERGTRLSGGERQRIALARVLLRDPPILILDEATSALDAESERLVHDALARVVVNRTVILIAHRLSTLTVADHIAVLDQGRIVETGPHDELIVAGGLYQRLHTLHLAVMP